ncbi:MAG: hypothetical protein C4525_12480 [Desulfarculus sp.]|nr:MAG: hypothetical protein C4525_12480 [Desulfarculus sp.]
MSQPPGREQEGRALDFFGAVTASATHEIKNELAVINEQSHLMLEMLQMAAQGRQPDPQRLADLTGRIIARVGQADQVVRRLNTFAHSAEKQRDRCLVAPALELIVRCYVRLAALKGVSLELAPLAGRETLEIKAPPILLEQALWAALQAAVAAAASGSRLQVGLEQAGGVLRLRLAGELTAPPAALPDQVLAPLGATARAEDGALVLEIPLSPPPAA